MPAAAAQAVVVDTDRPKLKSAGYDFGGSTLVAGSPTSGGRLTFDVRGGKVYVRLTGTLHLHQVGDTCARMRLEYLDKREKSLTKPRHGGTVCVKDNRHRRFTVDLDPYADNDIHFVRVSVMKKSTKDWKTAASGLYAINGQSDEVKIGAEGLDFGGIASPIFGSLPQPGYMHWIFDGAEVRPNLLGFLHMDNVAGVCARMNLRYLTSGGTFLTARAGGAVCAGDNRYHWVLVNLEPYASSKIGKVKVQLQSQDSSGSWHVVGSQTVSVAE